MRTVVFVVFDAFQLLDLAGPVEVLRTATLLGADPPYHTTIAAPGGRRSARTESGVAVTADVPLAELAQGARRTAMSPRSFARAFVAETDTTPAVYVEGLRVEAARRLLESTELTMEAVAKSVGLRRVETLHRAFKRRVGTTPDQYRRHFGRRQEEQLATPA